MRNHTATITASVGVICNDCGQHLPIVGRTGDHTELLIIDHPICPHTLRRDGPDSYETWLAEATKEAQR